MRHKILPGLASSRSHVVVLDMDEDVLAELQQFFERERIYAAKFAGIGGMRRATLAYYDMEKKTYEPIAIGEQIEVVSFTGNVTAYENKPKIHAHCVVGHRDGRTAGGHFLSGIVRPTLELMVEELASPLRRSDRPDIGIPLIEL